MVVTKTELEALILENELIKRFQPRYNIRLKDDKSFPYIKINWQDDFPKIEIVRNMLHDGARYFGPYTSARLPPDARSAAPRLPLPRLRTNYHRAGPAPLSLLPHKNVRRPLHRRTDAQNTGPRYGN